MENDKEFWDAEIMNRFLRVRAVFLWVLHGIWSDKNIWSATLIGGVILTWSGPRKKHDVITFFALISFSFLGP